MTATQADHEVSPGCSLDRRQFMRRSLAAGATLATAGATSSGTVSAQSYGESACVANDDIPCLSDYGAAGIDYLASKAEDLIPFVGDSRDYSNYTGGEALKEQILIGALEMASADERVMTSIENNIENSENVSLAKGKAAIIEEMNAENAESVAQNAMQEAIDDYYATIQENILNHFKSQTEQMWHHGEQIREHEDTSQSSVFEAGDSGYEMREPGGATNQGTARGIIRYEDAGDDYAYARTIDYDLVNGESVEVDVVETGRDGADELHPEGEARVRYSYDGESVVYIDCSRYANALDAVLTKRDDVNANLAGFVTDVYDQYEPGEIPTEDLVDPITASTELRQDYDNAAAQGAHAAMMGIPTTADFSVLLHIYADDEELLDGADYWEVWAEIFTNYVPREQLHDGATVDSGALSVDFEPDNSVTYELVTTDDEIVDIDGSDLSDGVDLSDDLDTTDTSVDRLRGDETGFEVGQRYDPSTWDAPLYIAYEYEDGSDFTQIEAEFVVETAEDSDGNEVDNFETRSQNNQTSDIESLENELQQLREDWLDRQEEAQDDGTPIFGGGDGGLLDSIFSFFGFDGTVTWDRLFKQYYGVPAWFWAAGGATLFAVDGGEDN